MPADVVGLGLDMQLSALATEPRVGHVVYSDTDPATARKTKRGFVDVEVSRSPCLGASGCACARILLGLRDRVSYLIESPCPYRNRIDSCLLESRKGSALGQAKPDPVT